MAEGTVVIHAPGLTKDTRIAGTNTLDQAVIVNRQRIVVLCACDFPQLVKGELWASDAATGTDLTIIESFEA